MHSEDSPAASGGQATYDLLRSQLLRAGRAPSIGALLALSPDEPLAEFEPDESQKLGQVRGIGWTLVPRKITKAGRKLAERFPGLQLSYRKRERMKYGSLPSDGAPSSEYVRARISHAKALWSRDVSTKQTRLQFVDWLRDHIDGKRGLRRFGPMVKGGPRRCNFWPSCGLPRHPATKLRRWADDNRI